jgi:hypothetical protein
LRDKAGIAVLIVSMYPFSLPCSWTKLKNQDLTGKKKRLIIDNEKWVFTVQLVTACSFLFL